MWDFKGFLKLVKYKFLEFINFRVRSGIKYLHPRNEEVQGDGVATAGLYICFYGNIYDISYASDTDLS